MSKIALILFVASELLYYLLIAQTGIVEYFSSDLLAIAPLPISGIIGSYLVSKIELENDYKLAFALFLQLVISFFYPNLNILMLVVLGFSMGFIAPLLINELKKATYLHLGIALSISYSIGTYLFTSEVSQRGTLAITLTTIALVAIFFLPKEEIKRDRIEHHSLLIMSLWIFLDSTLFEILSRDESISIWRDGYTFEIMLFHIIGVFLALAFNFNKIINETIIFTLFILSYLLFYINQPLILAIIYPIVISYYNVIILKTLIQKDFKTIAVYMIFIGWVASGVGLGVALTNTLFIIPLVILYGISQIKFTKPTKKEFKYV